VKNCMEVGPSRERGVHVLRRERPWGAGGSVSVRLSWKSARGDARPRERPSRLRAASLGAGNPREAFDPAIRLDPEPGKVLRLA